MEDSSGWGVGSLPCVLCLGTSILGGGGWRVSQSLFPSAFRFGRGGLGRLGIRAFAQGHSDTQSGDRASR